MKYEFLIADVFSKGAFGGNQLAVLPNAAGLSTDGMQTLAQEFNFAETAFVYRLVAPANAFHVRIFTPKAEVPFAGHPTIGTACALAMLDGLEPGSKRELVLKEDIGSLRVSVENKAGILYGTLIIPGNLQTTPDVPANEALAEILMLDVASVRSGFFASVGLPFCFVHLASDTVVDRAQLDRASWNRTSPTLWSSNIFLFSGEVSNGSKLYARMFAPALGIEEDAATGSACAALVGYLATQDERREGTYGLQILQGVAMGRPSTIEVVAQKKDAVVSSITVGGYAICVAAGEIEVPCGLLVS
ncbi:trans-2,3-dihydro-3-hydroxyanthranilate isomerase [Bradyrhizobium sp. USDA 4461]